LSGVFDWQVTVQN